MAELLTLTDKNLAASNEGNAGRGTRGAGQTGASLRTYKELIKDGT